MNFRPLAPVTLSGLALFMLVSAFLGDNGLVKTYKLFLEKHRLMLGIQKLGEQNETLKQEIALLKNNDRHLKRKIKEELGMVEEKEIIYQFSEN
jgi:cell division protein FtsB